VATAEQSVPAVAVLDTSVLAREIRAGRYTPTLHPYDGDDHTDECVICHDGGELFCCDFCPNAEHMECVASKLGPGTTIRHMAPEDDFICHSCIRTAVKLSSGQGDIGIEGDVFNHDDENDNHNENMDLDEDRSSLSNNGTSRLKRHRTRKRPDEGSNDSDHHDEAMEEFGVNDDGGNDDGDDDDDDDDDDNEAKDNDSEQETKAPTTKRRRRVQSSSSSRKSTAATTRKRGRKKTKTYHSDGRFGPEADRTCPFCKKVFSIILGLAYHIGKCVICGACRPRSPPPVLLIRPYAFYLCRTQSMSKRGW